MSAVLCPSGQLHTAAVLSASLTAASLTTSFIRLNDTSEQLVRASSTASLPLRYVYGRISDYLCQMRFNGGFKELIYGRVSRPASLLLLLQQSCTHLAAGTPVIIPDRYEDLQASFPPLACRPTYHQVSASFLSSVCAFTAGPPVGPKLYHYRHLSFLESCVFSVSSDCRDAAAC